MTTELEKKYLTYFNLTINLIKAEFVYHNLGSNWNKILKVQVINFSNNNLIFIAYW